ncbi:3-oxoadipate enol-lactonase [Pseudomonas sp. Choline-3u-10]|jgi:3-oxoadipate enol-lactonase|uniref:3-oxoadipate enol-lactonase n=1 Tax=Pseudomonadaceae TaxID=135621 RepID=UPI000617B207|nr:MULTISPECIES: 3-oxoadipate enol-lactonase [Pseudomonadaceae]MBU0947570.1 3-oxoadipate enol-lactonase [Gammaproteobacteria bacterium]HBM08469.1 3-oxoadipate enol-lactonase [Pseudomonas sp.]KJJ62124.1 3-oxoadipate enol-lactonase [Pseudomonas sp. 10B238]MBK3795464.1 3-oxoadipate enol-lactonase [Stutzerimonas stutzeri]MBK3878181.1 3-oxoadipate enol-lactonase [Stutzerimonas stutzeri]|tara:strand:+ start:283 stop:1071 length:789 start_codon:yes stop_codon:yes gene_type:complete
MPSVKLADGELNYRFDGPVDAPVLVLSNSLGTTLDMWDSQVPVFSERFRVLRYDTRGHGSSSVMPGPYTTAQLGQDVLDLVDALSIDRFAFCGLSMGGLIGQWLGIHAGERLSHLVLCNTGAKIGTDEAWNERIDGVLRGGEQAMRDMRDASVARWFTHDFAAQHPVEVGRITQMVANTSPAGYAANCAAVRDADYREQLGAIKVPTLVVCGSQDPVTTPEHGRLIKANVAGARLIELNAAHLSNVEAGDAFTLPVMAFLCD